MLSINSIRYYQENHKMMKIIENNRIFSFGVFVINSTEFKSQVCHINCVNFVKPPNLTIGCLIYKKRMIKIFNSQSCFVRFKLQNEYEALNTVAKNMCLTHYRPGPHWEICGSRCLEGFGKP